MSDIRFVVAHAGWAPGRKQGLSRVLEVVPDAHVISSKRREHASVWATRLWDWCAEQEADYVVCLNDDILPHLKIRPIVDAIITAVGPRILSLFTNNPYAKPVREAGHHWCRCYWLTGPMYGFSPKDARSLLDWVDKAPSTLVRNVNEDNWAIHWAWDRQDPIWGTIPGLATHDVEIPSTLGYDNHPNRNSHVPHAECEADLTDPNYWRTDKTPPWVPNPWMGEPYMATIRRMVRSGTEFCELCTQESAILKGPRTSLGPRCIDQLGQTLQNLRRAAALKEGQEKAASAALAAAGKASNG